ncbi:hypothetical protein OPKNFCMD_4464 [Methylobacterium crusticola]|uniref:Uncharacterized protein n=1 Tax=Methylobacterium crusticola TaxID=1697972 RepID=A0ABQ4R4J2_9HYPH|nr:hypothetical protein OPKNFCMD_4464 [Methylobacterium crusticola]
MAATAGRSAARIGRHAARGRRAGQEPRLTAGSGCAAGRRTGSAAWSTPLAHPAGRIKPRIEPRGRPAAPGGPGPHRGAVPSGRFEGSPPGAAG